MKKNIRYHLRYVLAGVLRLTFALLGLPLYLLCSFFDYGHSVINEWEIKKEAEA